MISSESFKNLPEILIRAVEQNSDKPALLWKQNGSYQTVTRRTYLQAVQKVFFFLSSLGIQKKDRVAILCENRPEWAYVDFGVLSMGAILVPIYATSSSKEACYIMRHSGAKVVFVSNEDQFNKIQPLLIETSNVRRVVVLEPLRAPHQQTTSWAEAIDSQPLPDKAQEQTFFDMAKKIVPSDVATLIYTSGTTGPPKGVMLTHKNFLTNCVDAREAVDLNESDITLSFLPLSHVFERMAGHFFPTMMGAVIAYAEDMNHVSDNLIEVKPTVACCVPRLFEKMHDRIQQKIKASSTFRRCLAELALKTAQEALPLMLARKELPAFLRLKYGLFDCLIYKKIRASLGGRMRFFISGGAPLAKYLGEFFYSIGVHILEGYGLTETSPVIAVNRMDRLKFGTVGIPFRHVEVRIGEDGEIIVRGDSIMLGYFEDPAATNEVIRDGWFYTGDIGELDADGFLKITDRKKDIIVTSGGKNIAPQNIEQALLKSPLIQQCMVLGDRRNFLVALIVPHYSRLAQECKLTTTQPSEIASSDKVRMRFEEEINELTVGFSSYEKIKNFRLLTEEMSQDGGELTPTLKTKRKVVMDKYKTLIDAMYSEIHNKSS